MASLHFHYSAMNSGKSTHLLQVAHNYRERGLTPMLVKPKIDTRDGDFISSRLGVKSECLMVGPEKPIYPKPGIDVVLVDEAQFLTVDQVNDLISIVDDYDIPVMCYGLMADSNGELFPGSAALVVHAEHLVEHKTICWCGSKATMNMRIDAEGNKIIGEQVCIGGNDSYISVCRKHWFEGKSK